MENSIGGLAKALVKFHQQFDGVVKDGRNGGFKNQQTGRASEYMTLDGILDTIRKPLADVGLVVVQRAVTNYVDAPDGRKVIQSVYATTILLHESGEQISGNCEVPVSAPTAHAIGSAMTYARRYGITALLAISADNDDDGNEASGLQAPRPKLQPLGKV